MAIHVACGLCYKRRTECEMHFPIKMSIVSDPMYHCYNSSVVCYTCQPSPLNSNNNKMLKRGQFEWIQVLWHKHNNKFAKNNKKKIEMNANGITKKEKKWKMLFAFEFLNDSAWFCFHFRIATGAKCQIFTFRRAILSCHCYLIFIMFICLTDAEWECRLA